MLHLLRRNCLWCLCFAGVLFGTAGVSCADSLLPTIVPTGHSAAIKGLAFSPDGETLISAGYDKAVLLWDLNRSEVRNVIRGEAGPGAFGRIFALALSPDGKRLAVAGFMAPGGGIRDDNVGDVLLFDTATGRLVKRLKGHGDSVNDLAFSTAGNRLLSGGNDGTVILWDLDSFQMMLRLSAPSSSSGEVSTVLKVRFSPNNGAIVAARSTQSVQIWDETGTPLRVIDIGAGGITGMDVSRAGLLAVTTRDLIGEIRLWDIATGLPAARMRLEGVRFGPVLFTMDGLKLVSGDWSAPYYGRIWSVPGLSQIGEFGGHAGEVTVLAVSADGRRAASVGGRDRSIDVWRLDERTRMARLEGLGQAVWSVGFSGPKAQYLGWGYTSDVDSLLERGPIEWQLKLPSPDQTASILGSPVTNKGDRIFSRAIGKRGDWQFNARSLRPGEQPELLEILKGSVVTGRIFRTPATGFDHRATSFNPSLTSVVSGGSNGVLARYELDGGQTRPPFVGHEGDVWGVAVSPDGRLLASASADQTVRLWNFDTSELIASLFQARSREWVIWTPQGYFASSPDGDRLIGWQVNRGPELEAEFVTAAQIRRSFYRPDIVERAILLGSAKKAIEQSSRSGARLEQLEIQLPPRFKIASIDVLPADSSTTHLANVTLTFEQPVVPLPRLEVYVDDRAVDPIAIIPQPDQHQVRVQISHVIGGETIRIIADGEVGLGDQRGGIPVQQVHPTKPLGKLYVVAIGVDEYPQLPGRDLHFAALDAKAFVTAFEHGAKSLYTDIETHVLTTGNPPATAPTAGNIVDTLDAFAKATDFDTVLLFIAGHGEMSNGEYYFLPATATRRQNDGSWLASTTIQWVQLQEALFRARGRRILFVDTCHAERAYNQRLMKDSSDGGIFVFAATDANSVSYEKQELLHGVFTYALLQELQIDPANPTPSKEVRLISLAASVSDLVAKLTNNQQVPSFNLINAQNFVISVK